MSACLLYHLRNRGLLVIQRLAILLVLVLVGPSAVRAQDAPQVAPPVEDARTLFQRGQAAYAQGDYDASIAHWSRAFEIDQRPLLQFNLSQAYERLGRLEEAITALQFYLDHSDPSDEHQADARARLASLRERLGRTRVQIVGGPEGATILIDGEDRGRTPRPDPIQVTPGSHQVLVRMSGQTDFTSSVVVPAGQTVEVQVRMTPAAAAAAPSGGEAPIGPIVLMAGGAAIAIVGAILGGVALSQASNAFEGSAEASGARTTALVADILIPAGAACALGGLIWLLVAPGGSSSETPTAMWTPYVGPDAAGVIARGTF